MRCRIQLVGVEGKSMQTALRDVHVQPPGGLRPVRGARTYNYRAMRHLVAELCWGGRANPSSGDGTIAASCAVM